MTSKLLIACLLVAMAVACSSFALGQSASCQKGNISAEPDATVKNATQFLNNLQQAIKAGNRTQVMDLVHFPLTASTTNATLHIEDSKNSKRNSIQSSLRSGGRRFCSRMSDA